MSRTRAPASSGQERLLWLHEIDPGSTAYHIFLPVLFSGGSERSALDRCLNRLLERHPLLTVTFIREPSGEVTQATNPNFRIPVEEVSAPSFDDWEKAARPLAASPFDLMNTPSPRAVLVRCADGNDVLVLALHHSIGDGRSIRTLYRDLKALYLHETEGAEPDLPLLESDYLSFAASAPPGGEAGPDREDRESYWHATMLGAEPVGFTLGGIPSARHRDRDSVELCRFELASGTTRDLEHLALRRRSTLTCAIAALFQSWLARHSGQKDITTAIALDSRPGPEYGDVVGFFVDTLPLRGALDGDPSLNEFIRRLTPKLLTGLRHKLPYEEIIAQSGHGSDPVNALFLHHGTATTEHADGSGISRLYPAQDSARYDIELSTRVLDDRLVGILRLRSHLIGEGRAAEIGERFAYFLTEAVSAPETPLSRHPLLAEAEARQVISAGRGPVRESAAALVPDLLAQQVAARPDDTALVADGSRLTFGELGERVSRMAHALIRRGVGPEHPVAVLMPRSEPQIVSLLALLSAGAVFVPVDPEHPVPRNVRVLRSCGTGLLLSTRALSGLASRLAAEAGLDVLSVDDEEAVAEFASHPPYLPTDPQRRSPLRPENAAYIIHTSGSTGHPKGVVVEHRQIANLADHLSREMFAPTADQVGRARIRATMTAALSFDVSWQGLLALVTGHELHVVPEEVRRDPEAYTDYLLDHRLDLVDATPTHAAQLLGAGLLSDPGNAPARLVLAGEAVQPSLWERLSARTRTRTWNYYGPTESTVYATSVPVREGSRPRIGGALTNVGVYVLDENLAPVPSGVRGEIYLTGAQNARGYLGLPGVTAERFVADPYGPPGSRMYRTGDLGFWDTDGRLGFEGRADGQIKLRGHRIELGEIESALGSRPEVEQAAVVTWSPPGARDGAETQLAAYVVCAGSADIPDLRRHLAERLPSYMVPTAYVPVDDLPLNTSGKLDKRALPDPAPMENEGAVESDFLSPREEVICRVFAQTLNMESVGRKDDFFDLGGHSLLLARVISRIRSSLGTDLRIRDVLDHPTPAALASLLDSRAQTRPPLNATGATEGPLSPAQQRLWFLARAEGPSSTYNIPIAIRMSGELDTDALRDALHDVMARHGSLRTEFFERDGVPHQRMVPEELCDPRMVHTVTTEDRLPEQLDAAVHHAFDLTLELPFRSWVYRLGPTEHVVLLLLHHISGDGSSMAPLRRDLVTAYEARIADGPPVWTALPVTYPDYAAWHHEVLGEEEDPDSLLNRQMQYWRSTLAGSPSELDLPTDRPRPTDPAHRAHVRDFSLKADTHHRMSEHVRAENVSTVMFLRTAVASLLSKLGAGTDIPLGGVVTTRVDEALSDMVGFFVNTQVLRIDTSGDPDFRTLLDRVRETSLAAYDHHDLPFEKIVESLNPPRALARHPLFQTMVLFQELPSDRFAMGGLSCRREPTTLGAAKFDLCFTFSEQRDEEGRPEGLHLRVEASTDLYEGSTVERLGTWLTRLLDAVCEHPEASVGELELLAEDERRQLLESGRGARSQVPERTVPEIFGEIADRMPEEVAVSQCGEPISYSRLRTWSGRLAREFLARGVAVEDRVALLLDRSPAMVAAPLAVLMAGGAYVPLHATDPDTRLRRILSESDARLLVTVPAYAERAALLGVPVYVVGPPEEDEGHAPPPAVMVPDNLAYVIHTSGSTGRPKGVAATHRNIAELAADQRWEDSAHQHVLMHSPLAFDASTYELWVPLLTGGRIELAPPGDLDLDSLARLLDSGVTAAWLTSGLFQLVADLAPRAFGRLREVWAGGDVVPPSAVARVQAVCPDTTVVNGYGPTETTTFATSHRADRAQEPMSTMPIGSPLDNTTVHVLDDKLRPVPPGVPGELYISGAGLTRGYLGRPSLTGERFVACPFGPPGGRMYRTGDLVKWVENGRLVFLGRSDHQVKLRGYRIELAEIENALARHPSVGRAVAVLRKGSAADGTLVGYVTAGSGGTLESTDVLEFVRASLPTYMVPSTVVVLDRMPLTANGKVDRRALPAPSGSTGAESRAPHGSTERAVCELFAEILGTDGVHADQDFFAAGGSSLLVMRLVSRIRRTLRREIGIRDVFEAPTPAALATRLSETGEGSNTRPPLRAAPEGEAPVMAPAQRGLWFLQQLEGFRAAYNVPYATRLSGVVDEGALRSALREVAIRHDALRTLYPADRGEPSPVVVPPDSLPDLLSVVPTDVSGLPALLQAESNLGFDLVEEVPWRAVLFRCDGGEDVLSLVFHHLAFDGWSLAPFWRDLADAYDHHAAGGAPGWEPLPFRYADYAAWQHRLLGPEDGPTDLARRQLDFWERTLAGLPEELSLPFDYARPHGARLTAKSVKLRWTEESLSRLNALARRENTSLLIVVQAAVACFLSRISGGTDVPLGTPVAGRTDETLNEMVGYFVNTVVVRTDLSGAPSFGELVRRTRGRALAAFEHQDVPFDRVVELLGPDRVLGRNPLFQTMVTCARAPKHRSGLGGVAAIPEEAHLGSAKFDLSFDFLEEADGAGLECRMLYCAELFSPETAEGLADQFRQLVLELCADPELPLAEIRPRNTVVDNDRPDGLPPLPQLLRERIDASPDDIALVHDGARLTYAELGRRVDRLAGLLTEYGVGPERKVGVLVPRSDLQIVALLAVLAAGGVFLPLDPSHPTARNEGILRSAEAVVVIDTAGHPLPETALPQVPRLTLDAPGTLSELQRAPDHTRSPVYPAPEQAAYMIHTSGSTGRPKGVVVEHRQLSSFFAAMVKQVFDPGARHLAVRRLSVSLTAALTFDASWQGLAALAAGHELHVVPEEVRRDPDAYTEYLLDHGVDLVDATPTFAESLIASGLLRAEDGPGILLLGGEPVDQRLWDTLRSRGGIRAYNVYGPTETTVNATACLVEDRSVPRVGEALDGTCVYVLDSDLRPVAPFVPGEIYLAGSQVARGYGGRPALTAERFVADPHGPPGSRMYRTGDLGYWDASGHLAFSGRSDEQVKLRGVRIEPGEIATVISEHPDVEHTVVLLRDSAAGAPHLVAYVCAAEEDFSPARLRRYASERLPSYLVPAEYVRIDGIPLTSSGKLDRGSLPAPRRTRPAEARAAQTPQEEALCRLFAEVLETDGVGPDDDFFMLGGHSLLAVRLTNRIREEHGMDFSLEALIRARTVAGLLGLSGGKSGEDPFATVVPLREEEGLPLFCVHPVTGLAWSYSGLARRLPTGTPVHGIQAAGLRPGSAKPGTMEEMAETYLQHLRGVQPRGPYRLLGWSFGGNVAHAMATRLQALGESVSLLALVDSYPLGKIAPLRRDPGEASELTGMHLSTEVSRQLGTDRLRRIESVVRNNLELGDRFHPGVFRGNVLAFTADEKDRASWIGPSMWEPHVDGVIDVRELPYAHFDLMGPDSQARIAQALGPFLRQATE